MKKTISLLAAPLLLSLLIAAPGDVCARTSGIAVGDTAGQPLRQVPYKVAGGAATALTEFLYPVKGRKHHIVKLAPQLRGLRSVVQTDSAGNLSPIRLSLPRKAQVLVGMFRDSTRTGNRYGQAVIKHALTITGMPPVDVFVLPLSKGTHTLDHDGALPLLVLGVMEANRALPLVDAGLPDGRLWEPFIVEGFYEKPLLQVVGGPDRPVVEEGDPGTEGIQGGFEGGVVVKVNGVYHMFPTERAGEKGMPAYYDRVKTRIGHWTSTDAKSWKRESTIYQASGTYALTDDDNPLNDRRGAIWSYMPVFNKEKNRWYGYYLTYTVSKEIEPNHSFGRIWQTESQTPGMEGIGGPYNEGRIIMEPGLDSYLWEGRQGVASFFPYAVGDHYLGFYAGAYPFARKEDYPRKGGKGWFIGLAKSKTLDGPWTRLDSTINPVRTMHPWFVENPIVYQMPNGLYLAVFDGGPEGWGHHLPNMMAYSLSADGYHWSEAHYLPIETKVHKWWNIMRTPLCLVPEGNDVYTIVYAAIQTDRRYHPMGMVQVKLDPQVLEQKKKELTQKTIAGAQ